MDAPTRRHGSRCDRTHWSHTDLSGHRRLQDFPTRREALAIRADHIAKSFSTARDARKVSAAIVSVGFAVVMVGHVPLPRRFRFLCSQHRDSAFTPDLAGSLPMR